MSPQAEIQVLEIYRGYRPCFNAAKLVRRFLRTVPAIDLSRLSHIVLTNGSMLVDSNRGVKDATKGEHQRILGAYHPWRHSTPAYIELRVDAISSQLNIVSRHIPFVREVAFGYVLFHEIAHHLHLKDHLIRPDLIASEGLADQWSHHLLVRALRQRYRYARPFWAPAIKTYWFLQRKQWL